MDSYVFSFNQLLYFIDAQNFPSFTSGNPFAMFLFFNMTTEIFSTFIAFQYNKNVSCLSLILPALNLESVISPGSLGSFYWDWYLGAWVLFS